MGKKEICPICNKELDQPIVDTCIEAYNYVIKRIKQEHPDWVEKDGACPKCIEYYKNL